MEHRLLLKNLESFNGKFWQTSKVKKNTAIFHQLSLLYSYGRSKLIKNKAYKLIRTSGKSELFISKEIKYYRSYIEKLGFK